MRLVNFAFSFFYASIFHATCSGSLFTNSNWFAFEDDGAANERSTGSLASPSPNAEETGVINGSGDDNVVVGDDEDLVDTATSSPEPGPKSEQGETDKPVEWVEWRESSNANDSADVLPNGELKTESGNNNSGAAEPSSSSSVASETMDKQMLAEPLASLSDNSSTETSQPEQTGSESNSSPTPMDVEGDSKKETEDEKEAEKANC